MLMFSLHWRALRLICQNTFHTLLLKLCPLLLPAFKLKQSPVCQRHAGRAASRPCGLRGQQSEGLSAAQVSLCFPLAPGQSGTAGSAWAHPGAWASGVEAGSQDPLKQDRLQRCPCDSAHKPEFKAPSQFRRERFSCGWLWI